MNSKSFIVAHFHECDSQESEPSENDVFSFSQSHGGILLLATDDTEIWAYPHEAQADEVERDWLAWTTNKDRKVNFEWIEDPAQWVRKWSYSFPTRIDAALKTFLESNA